MIDCRYIHDSIRPIRFPTRWIDVFSHGIDCSRPSSSKGAQGRPTCTSRDQSRPSVDQRFCAKAFAQPQTLSSLCVFVDRNASPIELRLVSADTCNSLDFYSVHDQISLGTSTDAQTMYSSVPYWIARGASVLAVLSWLRTPPSVQLRASMLALSASKICLRMPLLSFLL